MVGKKRRRKKEQNVSVSVVVSFHRHASKKSAGLMGRRRKDPGVGAYMEKAGDGGDGVTANFFGFSAKF